MRSALNRVELASTPVRPRAVDPAVSSRTLIDLLLRRADKQHGDVAYVVHQYGPSVSIENARRATTYGQLVSESLALAATLQERALDREPVLLYFGSGLEFIRAYCACVLAGAIPVPNPGDDRTRTHDPEN